MYVHLYIYNLIVRKCARHRQERLSHVRERLGSVQTEVLMVHGRTTLGLAGMELFSSFFSFSSVALRTDNSIKNKSCISRRRLISLLMLTFSHFYIYTILSVSPRQEDDDRQTDTNRFHASDHYYYSSVLSLYRARGRYNFIFYFSRLSPAEGEQFSLSPCLPTRHSQFTLILFFHPHHHPSFSSSPNKTYIDTPSEQEGGKMLSCIYNSY